MPTELRTNAKANDYTKKLWNRHQDNEYLKVNHYKEGLCYNCFKDKAVAATVVDICEQCFDKRAYEAVLVMISEKPKLHQLCFFCGKYKQWVIQYNVRLCQRCHRVVANILKRWNKKGGMFGNDPFWLAMKKKHGKDWAKIAFSPATPRDWQSRG